MRANNPEIKLSPHAEEVLLKIGSLPAKWHKVGTLSNPVLRALAEYYQQLNAQYSAETGTGISTLLASLLVGKMHTVFAPCRVGWRWDDSYTQVIDSPLFDKDKVIFEEGSSVFTLPQYKFPHPLQLALVDGAHNPVAHWLDTMVLAHNLEPDRAAIGIDNVEIPSIAEMVGYMMKDPMFKFDREVKVGRTRIVFFLRTDEPSYIDLAYDFHWKQPWNRPSQGVLQEALIPFLRRLPEPVKAPLREARANLRKLLDR